MKKILLITSDSLRADFIDLFGYPIETMPLFKKNMKDFALFPNFYSNAPDSPSSFPAILTGTYSLMYGGYDYMANERKVIFEHMKDAGCHTSAFNSNPFISDAFNYYRGLDFANISFTKKVGKMHSIEALLIKLHKLGFIYNFAKSLYHPRKMMKKFRHAYVDAETIVSDFRKWYEENHDKDFFSWVHFMDTHHPYKPPARFVDGKISEKENFKLFRHMIHETDKLTPEELEKNKRLYEGDIRYVDWALNEIIEMLKERGDYDDSLIIFSADHGDEFFEHGESSHHSKLYDDLTHIPCMVKFPGNSPAGYSENLASSIDILPTILEAVNVPKPPYVLGKSLKSIFEGKEKNVYITAQTRMGGGKVPAIMGKRMISCRVAKKKLIYYEDAGYEFFDLSSDPNEKNNIYEQMKDTDICKLLQTGIDNALQQIKDTDIDLQKVELTEDVKERLRALGYLQ